MAKANDQVRAGKVPFTADSTCWPGGVPGFDVYAHVRPTYFLETEKEITLLQGIGRAGAPHLYECAALAQRETILVRKNQLAITKATTLSSIRSG